MAESPPPLAVFDTYNLLHKLYAILVSDEVSLWHFPEKKEPPRFFYWLCKAEPDNTVGHGCATLEEAIEAAYAYIDPLRKPLPAEPTLPPRGADADHA